MNLLQLVVRMLHSRSMTGGCSYDGAWSLLPPLRGISYFQYALLRSSIPLDKIELNYSVWYLKFGTPPNSGPCVAVTAWISTNNLWFAILYRQKQPISVGGCPRIRYTILGRSKFQLLPVCRAIVLVSGYRNANTVLSYISLQYYNTSAVFSNGCIIYVYSHGNCLIA